MLDTFQPEIAILADANSISYELTVERMTRQYDGYHFSANAEGVFNPFSVLNVLKSKQFDNYWFQTGTPTFLVEMLQETEYDLRILLDGIEAPSSIFSEYRVDSNNPIPLIYQSGYLTLSKATMLNLVIICCSFLMMRFVTVLSIFWFPITLQWRIAIKAFQAERYCGRRLETNR